MDCREAPYACSSVTKVTNDHAFNAEVELLHHSRGRRRVVAITAYQPLPKHPESFPQALLLAVDPLLQGSVSDAHGLYEFAVAVGQ